MIKSISLASSCVVNLNEKLNLLVHTVILRIVLGTSYEGKEFESGGNLSELLHGAIAMMGAFFVLSLFPYAGRVIALFTRLQQKLDKNFNELDALLQQAVDEHSDPDRQTGEYEDIVDVLLRLEKEQFGEFFLLKITSRQFSWVTWDDSDDEHDNNENHPQLVDTGNYCAYPVFFNCNNNNFNAFELENPDEIQCNQEHNEFEEFEDPYLEDLYSQTLAKCIKLSKLYKVLKD
ncbi:hypothetical protein GIB67_008102 [Kingdonia uniflora]|uniref:Uncharacterized protein n=1 Tax=Kingdonia uniflora TaxID=39325 RepID=A0A7J7MCN9_9MAGN|nr:hypothetical protein GIB67_008102 [Kingdonia uniflora]